MNDAADTNINNEGRYAVFRLHAFAAIIFA